jgi:hypothetical protein
MGITRGYFFGILRDYYIVLLCPYKIQKPSCEDHTTFIPFLPPPEGVAEGAGNCARVASAVSAPWNLRNMGRLHRTWAIFECQKSLLFI